VATSARGSLRGHRKSAVRRRSAIGPDPCAPERARSRKRLWLFDLDNTLHDASHAAFAPISAAMTRYIVEHLGFDDGDATALRQRYWKRYGATLLGLVRHHAISAAHFLEHTHRLPGLEDRLRSSAHDRAALARLAGRKFVLTNAPRDYALRVLDTLGLATCFDGVIGIEDMAMFGQLRPKPDARMLRRVAARLKVAPTRCVLVEDTLEHQKAARGLGMTTVWMRRYLGGRFRGAPFAPRPSVQMEPAAPAAASRRTCPKPAYVCARINSLQKLMRA
jgi:putative hydrolase of the HAD superfamily